MTDSGIKKFVWFATVFVILAVGIDVLLINGLRHYQGGAYFDVWNQIMDGHAGADIVIAGSSRALKDFDCQKITQVLGRSCYNTGIDGGLFNLESALLRTYFKYDGRPQILIQVVGISDFEPSLIYHEYQFVPYLNEDEIYRSVVKVNPQFLYYKYVPLYGFTVYNDKLIVRAVKGLLNIQTPEEDWELKPRVNGFLAVDKPWSDEFQRFKLMYPRGKLYPMSEGLINDLGQLIRACQQHKIKVLLVFPPVYHESIYGYARNVHEIFRIYRSMAARYHIPFMDYSMMPLTGSTGYFYNSQHLNKTGAAYFSTIFAKNIKNFL